VIRAVESVLAVVALAVLALGLALMPLQAPAFTRVLSARHSTLPESVRAPFAEATRSFVVSGDSAARRRLESAMPADAVSHLDDVRRVLAGGNAATATLAGAVLVWGAWSIRSGRARAVARALLGAAGVIAVVVGGSLLVALVDFDAFFSAFHSLFFAAGTWTFPSDSLLIRLFPEAFWSTAGLVWGVLVAVFALLYGLLGWLLRGSRAAA
jgi:integral membrane protein (TIGR01906 family)